jgi:zinc protease
MKAMQFSLIKKINLILLTWIMGACASTQKQVPANAFGGSGLVLPTYTEKQLPNGLKVIYIKDSSLPKLSITSLIRVGSVNEAPRQRGLNYLTASLLDEGTDKHTSTEIAERMEFLGGKLSVSPGADFTTLSVNGLSFTKVELADAFLEVLLTPKFPDNEISRIRKQVQSQIKKQSDDPDGYADLMFYKMIFIQHPYAYPSYGTSKTLERLSRKDVLNHYQKYYLPNNTQIAVVGDFDEAFERQFEAKIMTWNHGDSPAVVQSQAVAPAPAQIFFLGKKSLVQTQIRLGHVFIERGNPDFIKLRLANMALGGAFASRLNQIVRDDLGLSYGVHSYFDAKKQSGVFEINTFTRNEKVYETIEACKKVFKEFHEGGLKPEELQAAKSVMIGQFPRAVETMDALAYNMLVLRFYGVDDTYLSQFNATVNSYSLDQVNTVLRQHFQPSGLQIVVFGEDKVIDQLKKISKTQTVPANWQD